LQDFFQRLERHLSSNLPFVVYKKPNAIEIKGLLQSNEVVYKTTDFTETGFVFSPFDNEADSILVPVEKSEIISSYNYKIEKVESFNSLNFDGNINLKKTFHLELINKGISEIKEGNLKKVVLSRTEDILLNTANPFTIFKKLLQKYSSAFVYVWYHPKIGLWLGATPETLLKIEGNYFSIMSLAGTKKYKGHLDVSWDKKELDEQQLVTDFIIEQIAPSIKNIKVSDIETVKAGNLVHLKTSISGELKDNGSTLKDLLFNIHPTPAVCGITKEKSKQFILNNENYKREFYTGFLGELNFEIDVRVRNSKNNIENRAYNHKRKSTQLYVNLRCMQLLEKTARIYIGGGITNLSIAKDEWEETVAKSLVIKSVL